LLTGLTRVQPLASGAGGSVPQSFGHVRHDVTLKEARSRSYVIGSRTAVRLSYQQRSAIKSYELGIRTANFDFATHSRQKFSTPRLSSAAWPSCNGKALWPSYPTLGEWMEMKSKGKTSCSVGKKTGKTCRVSRRALEESPELAQRIVRRHIIGVRSDCEVPDKYLGYFRYCRGFLILTAPKVPVGLARNLLARWVNQPTSLWLEWPGTLKQYLREVPWRVARPDTLHAPNYDSLSDSSEGEEESTSASGVSRSERHIRSAW